VLFVLIKWLSANLTLVDSVAVAYEVTHTMQFK